MSEEKDDEEGEASGVGPIGNVPFNKNDYLIPFDRIANDPYAKNDYSEWSSDIDGELDRVIAEREEAAERSGNDNADLEDVDGLLENGLQAAHAGAGDGNGGLRDRDEETGDPSVIAEVVEDHTKKPGDFDEEVDGMRWK